MSRNWNSTAGASVPVVWVTSVLALFFISCVGHGTWYEPYVVAVRIMDREGEPAEGVSVFATDLSFVSREYDYFGETDADGYAFGVLPLMECRSTFFGVISGRATPPRDIKFFVEDNDGWLSLGSTTAVRVPKSEEEYWDRRRMFDRSQRQIVSFPEWATNVKILDATIEVSQLQHQP